MPFNEFASISGQECGGKVAGSCCPAPAHADIDVEHNDAGLLSNADLSVRSEWAVTVPYIKVKPLRLVSREQ